MPYRAIITFDFGNGHDANRFQQMETALLALGWQYAETSAFVYNQAQDDGTLPTAIWQAIAILGRASSGIGGRLSALSFQVQYIDPTKQNQQQFGAWQQASALTEIQKQVFPGDSRAGNL